MTIDELLEDYPNELAESIAQNEAWRRKLADDNSELEFIVSDAARWVPGSDVKVAFLGGSAELHRKIAGVAKAISDSCSINLDFGAQSNYRTWSENDTSYSADIRISFDKGGYWSLVGSASVDPSIGPRDGGVGGRPNQRSLNLGGYDEKLPASWQRTVLHELLHALAFKHEHQNMRGPCQNEFRWEDDRNYVATTKKDRFVADKNGKRPGIYTYLGGAPNNWSRRKIDHNLRSAGAEEGVASNFDPESVMLYRFPSLFYKSDPSPCAPVGNGDRLSDGDRRGLRLLYTNASLESSGQLKQIKNTDKILADLDDGLESVVSEQLRGARSVLAHLERKTNDLS